MNDRARLRRSEDFQAVRRNGRTHHHAWVSLNAAPNGLPHTRCGFITGKVLGNAVVRNRVRRQLREHLRAALPHLRPGCDIVIIARKPLIEQPFAAQAAVLHTLFVRAGLWQEKAEPS